jgi:hypothetical protein
MPPLESLDAIAVRFLTLTGNSSPSSDARALAACLGLHPTPSNVDGAYVQAWSLFYDERLSFAEQQRAIAVAVAGRVLERFGERATEERARRLAPLLVRLTT